MDRIKISGKTLELIFKGTRPMGYLEKYGSWITKSN
jgi:hypothetical protein